MVLERDEDPRQLHAQIITMREENLRVQQETARL